MRLNQRCNTMTIDVANVPHEAGGDFRRRLIGFFRVQTCLFRRCKSSKPSGHVINTIIRTANSWIAKDVSKVLTTYTSVI